MVRISVFQNPELTLETRVTEGGVVSYPLLGSVRIGGQTVTAAEKLISDGLRKGSFVKSQQVTLVARQPGQRAGLAQVCHLPLSLPMKSTT